MKGGSNKARPVPSYTGDLLITRPCEIFWYILVVIVATTFCLHPPYVWLSSALPHLFFCSSSSSITRGGWLSDEFHSIRREKKNCNCNFFACCIHREESCYMMPYSPTPCLPINDVSAWRYFFAFACIPIHAHALFIPLRERITAEIQRLPSPRCFSSRVLRPTNRQEVFFGKNYACFTSRLSLMWGFICTKNSAYKLWLRTHFLVLLIFRIFELCVAKETDIFFNFVFLRWYDILLF